MGDVAPRRGWSPSSITLLRLGGVHDLSQIQAATGTMICVAGHTLPSPGSKIFF